MFLFVSIRYCLQLENYHVGLKTQHIYANWDLISFLFLHIGLINTLLSNNHNSFLSVIGFMGIIHQDVFLTPSDVDNY